MKMNVLVFPCGSEIGLEIHQALKWSTHVELFGASSVTSNHGKYVYRNYLEGIPHVDSPGFIPALNGLIERHRIDFIIPAHDSVVLTLARNRHLLGCAVIGSPESTCTVCRSKRATYELFEGIVPTPRLYSPGEEIGSFPVFLKPDVGQGSKGTYRAGSPEEIVFNLKRDPSLLILEYLPGPEYTVDCFTDGRGELLYAASRERIRTMNGISVNTRRTNDPRFRKIAEAINGTIELNGAWFFQVKERGDGEPVLMEIAPRIAGAMGYNRSLGVNLPLLSVFNAMGVEVAITPPDLEIEMDRALINRYRTDLIYDHLYIDLDDTVILNGAINPFIVAFIHQCINRGVAVHLLTKTVSDMTETLKKHRINDLFDSLIRIEPTDAKHRYINRFPCIFMDDSFSERTSVANALEIPVFDTSAVEALLDWRF